MSDATDKLEKELKELEKEKEKQYEALVISCFTTAKDIAKQLNTSEYLKDKATIVIFEKMLPRYVRVKEE